MSFGELPAFKAAHRQVARLFAVTLATGVLSVWLFAAGARGALWPFRIPAPLAMGYVGLSFGIAFSGLASAAVMALARARLASASEAVVSRAPPPAWAGTLSQRWLLLRARVLAELAYLRSRGFNPTAMAGWLQTAAAGAAGALVVLGVLMLWRHVATSPPRSEASFSVAQLGLARFYGVGLVIAAFPLLVIERWLSGVRGDGFPEAAQLGQLVRVPMVTALVLGLSQLVASAGYGWAITWPQRAVAVMLLAVGAELAVRGARMIFLPFAPLDRRRAAAESAIVRSLLRLQWPSWRAVNTSFQRQFGVDLSRSWALVFIRQAAPTVLAGMALLGWLVSGVTALGANQRGVYERFGAPVGVLQSGLHLHLPWPMGVVRPVENGVVHQLPIEFLLPNGSKGGEGKEKPPVLVGAEAHPSEDSDRLWTGDHPFEGSYLIASQEDGRQSFQLVDVDMAVIYRVAPTDEAARNVLYRAADPDNLIQAISGQLLVRYFVQHTLLDVLGRSRETFARDFQVQLQSQLDALSTGLEVLSVSIEAIHPPPGAAPAYHDVQAAEIRATSSVFTSRTAATRRLSDARIVAVKAHDEALAAGAERVAQARGDAIRFTGDRQAAARGGPAFLIERRLAAVTEAVGHAASVLVMDHRLQGRKAPILDYRSGPATPAPVTPEID